MGIAAIRFSARDARGPAPSTLRAVRSRMARDGAVAFENLFPLGLLRRIRDRVLRLHDSGELRRRGLVRDVGGRYAAVLPFAGPFLERGFYANPKVLRVMAALLGSQHCIGSLEAVIALPGAGAQHQHIDGPLRFDQVVGGRKAGYQGDLSRLPPYAVTLCVPLCDLSEDNGPTAIWPGSQRAALRARPPGAARVARDYPVERMAGPFGRTFLFDYRVFHGGTPNFSREPRPVLMFVFTRSWFRDPNLTEVAPCVVIGARDLRRVPARHRPLFLLAPAARRALWA